jgi:hypothetical protein
VRLIAVINQHQIIFWNPRWAAVAYLGVWCCLTCGVELANCIANDEIVPRFRDVPDGAAKRAGYQIYWGDLHGHSNVSDGMQNIEMPKRETPEEFYTYGRDFAKLDFLALTDHAGNISKAEWESICGVAKNFDRPGLFVPLVGYEWSDLALGHKVAVFPTLSGGPVYESPSLRHLIGVQSEQPVERSAEFFLDHDRFLSAVKESGAILHVAHPSLGDSKTNWDYHDPDVVINVEMAGTTGNPGGVAETWFEHPEAKRQHPNQQGVEGCWVQDALRRGYRLGFLGVNDTHSCEPGLKAKTAVLAKELTREAVFDALRNRRVYAVSRDRCSVTFEINGHLMGEEFVAAAPLEIEFAAEAGSPIHRLEIVRQNETWRHINSDGEQTTLTISCSDSAPEETTWYYGRVLLANGHQAWTSPIWVAPRTGPTKDVSNN